MGMDFIKIKSRWRNKLTRPAFTLVSSVLAVCCWLLIAQAFFMTSNGAIATVHAERVAKQAEQNAAVDIARLKATDYSELDKKAAHSRKTIPDVGDGDWESEVTINPETTLDDDKNVNIMEP